MNHTCLVLVLGVAAFCGSLPAAEEAPMPLATPVAISQGEDGSVVLLARDVTLHGMTVRYEAQPHKNTIGYWTNQDDWVSWTFSVAKPGTFAVEVLQGCGKGNGGAAVAVGIGDQCLRFTVEDTGHFQNFVKRGIGQLTIKEPGVVTLHVKPQSKPGVAVMDLRQVVLTPVK